MLLSCWWNFANKVFPTILGLWGLFSSWWFVLSFLFLLAELNKTSFCCSSSRPALPRSPFNSSFELVLHSPSKHVIWWFHDTCRVIKAYRQHASVRFWPGQGQWPSKSLFSSKTSPILCYLNFFFKIFYQGGMRNTQTTVLVYHPDWLTDFRRRASRQKIIDGT